MLKSRQGKMYSNSTELMVTNRILLQAVTGNTFKVFKVYMYSSSLECSKLTSHIKYYDLRCAKPGTHLCTSIASCLILRYRINCALS